LSEFESFTRFFYVKPPINKEIATPKNIEHLSAAKDAINDLQSFTNESITESLMAVVANNNFKTGEFFMDLRVAVAGNKISPPINESMVILGKEESLSRIESFLAEK
jgi:glutamyl-tRNA synthetase